MSVWLQAVITTSSLQKSNNCLKKAVECPVKGCKRIMMREDYNQHVSVAAGSHYNLQSAEIQQLRRTIHDKVKNVAFSY